MNAIETTRLILRPAEESDVKAIFAYASNPNVGPAAGWKPHENPEETKKIMREVFLDKQNIYMIVLKENGTLMGSIGLVPDPKRQNDRALMLGYAIGEEYWGQGYTTEAATALIEHGFANLDIDLISAYCYPFNTASRRVMEKCGFEYEGTLKFAEKRYDGVILDNLCYALYKNRR